MIDMSWSWGAPGGTPTPTTRWYAYFTSWSALCIGIGSSGCLYFVPIERPVINAPPDILQPFELEDLELVMVADIEQVTVIAQDDDGDDLAFFWVVVPSDVAYNVTPATPKELPDGTAYWYSTLSLPRDPRLDGRRLQCGVTDLQDTEVVEWTVRVED